MVTPESSNDHWRSLEILLYVVSFCVPCLPDCVDELAPKYNGAGSRILDPAPYVDQTLHSGIDLTEPGDVPGLRECWIMNASGPHQPSTTKNHTNSRLGPFQSDYRHSLRCPSVRDAPGCVAAASESGLYRAKDPQRAAHASTTFVATAPFHK
jgi:hypothetical protein